MTDQLRAYPPVETPEPIEGVVVATGSGIGTGTGVSGSPAAEPPPARPWWRRAYLGRPQDPRWARPLLLAILGLSALLYLWNLSGNGYANEFYAAAVQSGTKSWSSMFFGSLDTGNFITVDKPPFALWVMEVSTRVFGFSSFAMLAPIALCGVATVGVLYSAVRRSFGHAAAAVAALVAALTPITVAIARDNNPDPVLVLLMTLGAWFTLEAMRTHRLRHLLWAAVMIGCAFNAKMLQAYIVLPALVLVYLYATGGGFWRRIRHLSLFTAVLTVASFWWMLIVDAIPASSRPYIGGSTSDSVWDLVIGYNGLGRITGNESGNGGGGAASFAGASGFGRLFNDILGTQISWLLPAAAILCVAAVVLRGRAPRTDPMRAALLLWGLWLSAHFVVFSYQQGTIHPYYVTTLGPAIGALVGGGGAVVWQRAQEAGIANTWVRAVLPVVVCISGLWSIALLHRTSYATWLVPVIAVAMIVAVATLVAMHLRPQHRARLAAVGLGALLLAGLAGPTAFAASAANSTVNGTNPLAGPSNGSMGGPGGGFGARAGGGDFAGGPGGGGSAGPSGQGGFGGGSGDGFGGQGGQPPSFGDGQSGQLPSFGDGNGTGNGNGDSALGGGDSALSGGGGGANAGVSSALVSYLEQNQGSAKWLVAVANSNSAASLELQTGKAVLSMWGFTGSDPAMTVARLQRLVSSGELKYVELSGGGMGGGGFGGGGPGGGNSASSAVQTWVQQNCTAVSVGSTGSSGSSSSSSTASSSGLYACTASSASSASTTA